MDTSRRTIERVVDAGAVASRAGSVGGFVREWLISMNPPVTRAATAPAPTRVVARAVRRLEVVRTTGAE